MADLMTVVNSTTHLVTLHDGRHLEPGASAADVDVDHHGVQALLRAGQVYAVEQPAEQTVGDILTAVGDDPAKAHDALAVERARPEGRIRKTLVERLTQIIESEEEGQ